ncbi:MAG: dephospho-CoA kinase [Eubacteriales bacterium]|nr:dephospho-CoA kinase [Eubacteriales bacterium]
MFVIGVTGGIGAGKSSFAGLLAEAGLPVLDADKISHELTQAGGRSMLAIEEAFGPKYLKPDGSLDRQAMSALAFQDKKSLDRLSAIIHQDVILTMEEGLQALSKSQAQAAVLDVPIPVKHGFLDRSDLVICIWADDEIRLSRLAQRGMAQAEAQRRMAVQLSREEYAKLADMLILNNGSLEDLRLRAQEILQTELAARGIKFKDLI